MTCATAAQTVEEGLDFWKTPADGAELTFDFPADFFCPGSPAIIGLRVALVGDPVVASKNLGGTDTVLRRTGDAVFSHSVAQTGLKIVALGLRSLTSFSVNCDGVTTLWKTKVSLQPGVTQPTGSITITRDNASGGTFDASFGVKAQAEFTNAADSTDVRGPLLRQDTIVTSGACWSYTPLTTHVVCPDPPTVDTDCDEVPDLALDVGTTNFFPGGIGCTTIGGGPGPGTTHEGPHKKTQPPNTPSSGGGGGGGCRAAFHIDACCDDERRLLEQALIPGVGFRLDDSIRSQVALRASSKVHAQIMLRRLESCLEVVGPALLREESGEPSTTKPTRVSRPRR